MKTFLLCAALLLQSVTALAEEDAQSNRFFLMVGGFWPDVNTTVRADGNGGRIGTSLDFESDLGLADRDALFMAGAGMRLGERHYIDLLYFKLARDADHTIDRTIEFGDRVFEAQATVSASFETEVIRLSYGYAFISNDKHLLLGQIGAHYTRVTAGLSLRGDRSVSGEADSDVPLPVLGLVYDYSITPKVRLELRAQIFRLEFEGIDGALDNLTASVSYAFTPRISAMVGYNYYSMDVDAQADRWNGSFDFDYHGPWLGVMVGFGSR
jgi:hypothetical protein